MEPPVRHTCRSSLDRRGSRRGRWSEGEGRVPPLQAHVAVALVALSCAIGTAVSGQKEPAMATINLDQQDNGRTVTVAPQMTIVLSLPENPSTGYSWQLHPFTGPALAVTADSFTPSTS